MVSLLIIADDFTGALDTGVQFASGGAVTRVVTNNELDFRYLDPSVQVLVMDAETRHLSRRAAYDIVYGITERAIKQKIPHIYKKTDSALRGNIGSELAAVLQASQIQSLPFFPSFPKMNRCTKNGILYIDGVPVDQSVFGSDPFEPVVCSSISELIRKQTTVPVSVRSLMDLVFSKRIPPGITVWDGETDQELMQMGILLQRHSGLPIAAGCAGFASVLSGLLNLSGRQPPSPTFVPSFLVICGSVNPITSGQLDEAERCGFLRIRLTPEQKLEPRFWKSAEGKIQLTQWLRLLKQHPLVILDSNDYPGENRTLSYADSHSIGLTGIRMRISESYGRILKGMIDQGLDSTLMITGGDTLLGCMRQLGIEEMEPGCELEPGIVLSTFHLKHRRWQVISKSGGFGSKDLLNRLAQQIFGRTPTEYRQKEEAI